jgi:hypothetical protein
VNWMKKWLKVLILIIVLILLAGSVFMIMSKVSTSRKISATHISFLKYMKCETLCPYENETDYSGNAELVVIEECRWDCQDKFYPSPEGVPSEDQRKIVNASSWCFSSFVVERDESAYKNCLNEEIEKHSDLIDLSDFSIELDYKKVDIEILDLVCNGNTAHVSLKISGDSVKGIDFIATEGGSAEFITTFSNTPLDEGNHEFDISLSKGYIKNIQHLKVLYISNRGSLLTDGGHRSDIKDIWSC